MYCTRTRTKQTIPRNAGFQVWDKSAYPALIKFNRVAGTGHPRHVPLHLMILVVRGAILLADIQIRRPEAGMSCSLTYEA